ncbi:hypothetical protein ACOMHN_013864 [Nucella lapillus]
MAADGKHGVGQTSKQLLYSEKFGGTLLEQKLQIVGKKREGLTKPCLPPPSLVLSQVKEFLPKLKAANEKLKDMPREEFDFEAVSSDGPVIEMNLALVPGLGNSDSEASSSSEEESEEEEVSGSEDSDGEGGPSSPQLLPPLTDHRRSRKRKLVEVLDCRQEERDNDDDDEEKDCGKRIKE